MSLRGLFKKKKKEEFSGMNLEEHNKYIQDKEKWVEIYNRKSNAWNWKYRVYLDECYDVHIAKGERLFEPEDFASWEVKAQEQARLDKEKWTEMKLRRIKNSRIKLTNAERYLAFKSGLGNTRHYVGDDGSSDSYVRGEYKTPAEIRSSIKRMRQRNDYQHLRDFDKRLRALKITNGRELYDFFYDGADDDWRSTSTIRKFGEDLGKFVIAENDIENLSEEEIEKLHILEVI